MTDLDQQPRPYDEDYDYPADPPDESQVAPPQPIPAEPEGDLG